jgi:hypothetical protein
MIATSGYFVLNDDRTESPTTRREGGLDFSALGGKRQGREATQIGAGETGCEVPPWRDLKTPN